MPTTKTRKPAAAKKAAAPERVFTLDLGMMFPRYVTAMKGFASTDQARLILCGIKFDRTVDGYLRLTATDSYKLGVLETMVHVPVDFESFVLRHKDLVDAVKVMGKGAVMFLLGVDLVKGQADFTNGADHKILAVTYGDFPRVDQLIPATDPVGTPGMVGFNPVYLADVCEAARVLDPKGNHPIRFVGGESPLKPHIFRAIVQDVGHLFGLVMPVRIAA